MENIQKDSLKIFNLIKQLHLEFMKRPSAENLNELSFLGSELNNYQIEKIPLLFGVCISLMANNNYQSEEVLEVFSKLCSLNKTLEEEFLEALQILKEKLTEQKFRSLILFHLETLVQMEEAQTLLLNKTRDAEFVNAQQEIIHQTYKCNLLTEVEKSSPQELQLLTIMYSEINSYDLAVKKLEFISKLEKKMKEDLQLELSQFIKINDPSQIYFKNIQEINWDTFDNFISEFKVVIQLLKRIKEQTSSKLEEENKKKRKVSEKDMEPIPMEISSEKQFFIESEDKINKELTNQDTDEKKDQLISLIYKKNLETQETKEEHSKPKDIKKPKEKIDEIHDIFKAMEQKQNAINLALGNEISKLKEKNEKQEEINENYKEEIANQKEENKKQKGKNQNQKEEIKKQKKLINAITDEIELLKQRIKVLEDQLQNEKNNVEMCKTELDISDNKVKTYERSCRKLRTLIFLLYCRKVAKALLISLQIHLGIKWQKDYPALISAINDRHQTKETGKKINSLNPKELKTVCDFLYELLDTGNNLAHLNNSKLSNLQNETIEIPKIVTLSDFLNTGLPVQFFLDATEEMKKLIGKLYYELNPSSNQIPLNDFVSYFLNEKKTNSEGNTKSDSGIMIFSNN